MARESIEHLKVPSVGSFIVCIEQITPTHCHSNTNGVDNVTQF